MLIEHKTNQVLFFENLSIQNLFIYLFKLLKTSNLISLYKSDIYYIDITMIAKKIVSPLFNIIGINIKQLEFKMMDIHDDNGELVRIRLPRVDMFEIQDRIIHSNAYLSLQHESWSQDHIIDYLNKGLIDGGINVSSSVARIVYLIEVVAWYMKKTGCQSSIFIINSRPWLDVYKNIAYKKNISLVDVNPVEFKLSSLLNLIRSNAYLYFILKKLKYRKSYHPSIDNSCSKYKIYVDGRGDLDLSNNGEHTDFFWLLNSEFPNNSVLYECENMVEHEYLTKYGVCSIGKEIDYIGKASKQYEIPRINKTILFNKEKDKVKKELHSYNSDRLYWDIFFSKYRVKVFLSWFKYDNKHIAIYDAINDNGGVLAIWQMALDGYPTTDLKINADIVFMYSNFSNILELQLNSKIRYKVITGYPKDYTSALLIDRAKKLRNKLELNGAKKIVFAIDENSLDDSRWHTGHELQRENYSYLLEKVLKVPWLGVVFKPKTAKTLYKRLGPVADLLEKAKKTGRCFIYDDSGKHTSKEQPLLAALSSDVCIHGHLSSGTAALECALEGIPTLLIDREGTPASKLNELPAGKVVFKDWSTAIDAVMRYFSTPNGIEGFGDWSSIIDELDPFRDGKAAYRMGTYLHWLMQGYEKGLDKETVMFDAAERYKECWGKDKVIYMTRSANV